VTSATDEVRAAVLQSAGRVIVESIRSDPPRPTVGGLARVLATGVCGTDFHHAMGGFTGDLPVVLGHEIVAEIVELGSEWRSRGFEVGQRVALEEPIACHSCTACMAGKSRLCATAFRYGAIKQLDGSRLWGGFADYVMLHSRSQLHPVPDDLSSADASFFIPLANGLSWIGEAARIRAGDVVVVIGPGQHGVACVAAARHLGAAEVVAVGTANDHDRLETARQLGASHVVATSADRSLEALILDITRGRGADIIVDASNSHRENVSTAVAMCAGGARIVIAARQRGEIPGDVFARVFTKEISIVGVNARSSRSVTEALRLLADKQFSDQLPPAHALAIEELPGYLTASAVSRPLHAVVLPTRNRASLPREKAPVVGCAPPAS